MSRLGFLILFLMSFYFVKNVLEISSWPLKLGGSDEGRALASSGLRALGAAGQGP